MDPLEAINADQPNVWLTSLDGFGPEEWGLLGFTLERMRVHFIKNSQPGALVVIFGSPKAEVAMRRKIIGLQSCSHTEGHATEFMSAKAWNEKEANPATKGRWNYAVKATRAWRVTPETRMPVDEFAPITYEPKRGRFLGSQGMRVKHSEATRLLTMDLVESSVFGEPPLAGAVPGPAVEILRPSKPGPVSQISFVTRESEGPKHLYVLDLVGDASRFLGYAADDRVIVKVGFSRSPETRRDDHNRALPQGAYVWRVNRSTFHEGDVAYPTSGHALAGERAMKDFLEQAARSLGGEFFLGTRDVIDEAWERGKAAAAAYQA